MYTDPATQELIRIEIIRLEYIIRYGRFSGLNKGRLLQKRQNLKRKEA
jgi:hypothetical protein